MGHPDEGQIRAFMDGEAGELEAELQAHLRDCPQCAAQARDQEDTLAKLSRGLSLLDAPPPLDRARAAIPGLPRAKGPWVFSRRNLPKAASLAILLTAGGAAALSTPPVRHWIGQKWRDFSNEAPAEAVHPLPSPETATSSGSEDREMAGASLVVGEGGLTIRIEGVQEGAEIRVLLVAGDQAGIFAGRGTRFRTESGLMEARDPPGSLTVEVPQGGQRVELLVDGVLFLRQTRGQYEIRGPVLERTPTEIRFGPSPPGGTEQIPREEPW